MPRMILVRLTYFRLGGKFSTEGEYEHPAHTVELKGGVKGVRDTHFHDIQERVQEMIESKKLPGLVEGASLYLIHLDYEGNEGPARLLMPDKLREVLLALEGAL